MDIVITGATGFIGRHLSAALEADGHRLVRLSRGPAGEGTVHWDPADGPLDPKVLEGVQVVIHLAGENVAGRWSPAKKAAIRDSRVNSTRLLSQAMLGLRQHPDIFLCASAVGYYGERGEEVVTEGSVQGAGFLADVCAEWENAAAIAAGGGVRTVNLRFPAVLHPSGGPLSMALPLFRSGLGGRLGSGRQRMSWVALEDAVAAVKHLIYSPGLSGPFNICSPRVLTNAEFTRSLARALHRPAFLPVPGWLLAAVLGEMAREVLLTSVSAAPKRLVDSGFEFSHAGFENALDYWRHGGAL